MKISVRHLVFSLGLGLGVLGGANAALLELSDTPLFITSSSRPNVLIIMDNSGSMNFTTDAKAGPGSEPDSRSEIARSAAKEVIGNFGDKFSIGLMAYQQSGVNRKSDVYYGPDLGTIKDAHYRSNQNGGGGGKLYVSVGEVDAARQTLLNEYLDTESYPSYYPPSKPLYNAGATPIEGTLYSALDYYQRDLPSSNGGPGTAPPNSCNNDYVLLITDGEPTVDKNNATITNTATGVAQCAVAADALLQEGIETFVIGFAFDDTASLDSIAAAGGTDSAYPASDSDSIRTVLNSIFSSIAKTEGSGGSLAANSSLLSTGTTIYQASFDSENWAGHLEAIPLSSSGVLGTASWDAAVQLDAQDWSNDRTILSWNGSQGVKFRTGKMTAAMQASLNDDPATPYVDSDGNWQLRLRYLRGKRANTFSGVTFRTREHVLGDIAHSSPVYVAAPSMNYPAHLETVSYSSFSEASAGRTPTVYAGSNDGMLHAFDAATGNELFAYIPLEVYRNLPQLTTPLYTHKPFVDGPITVGDAFVSGSWKTVLVGTLRGGGQSIYALDVTDPGSITEATAAASVLWEFSDDDDADLGYTYGQAAIVKLANGKWGAVFGNGYNNSEADGQASTTGRAALFVLDLADGSLIRKITVPSGSTATPNGLATPATVDSNGDHVVDSVYAGDLNGNLWKFDLSSSNPNDWGVAYTQGASAIPLFSAKDASGIAQPITIRPEVIRNSVTNKQLVLFGTGKYLELNDTNPANVGNHSFYAVDAPTSLSATLTRSNLMVQSVLATTTSDGKTYRTVSDDAVDWSGKMGWRIDLPETGEMVVNNPTARNTQIVFTTSTPAADACSVGGTSWFMEVDALTGGLVPDGVIDTNNDALIDGDDKLSFDIDGGTSLRAVSGFRSLDGFLSSPLILTPETPNADNPTELKLMTGSVGGVSVVTEVSTVESSRRLSWRQIR